MILTPFPEQHHREHIQGEMLEGQHPCQEQVRGAVLVVADATPLHDDDCSFMGLVCLSEDTRTLRELIDLSTPGDYYAK